MLPFTAEVFLSLFETYNRAIWPVQLIAFGLGAAAVLLALRPLPGSSRTIAGLLAACWVWIGLVFHMVHFAVIFWAAWLFGALFVIQSVLLAWTGAIRGRLAFRFAGGRRGWAGLSLMMIALAGSPAIILLSGPGWAGVSYFGVAPAPTAVFTLGLLLLAAGRPPRGLMAVPLLWLAAMAGMAIAAE